MSEAETRKVLSDKKLKDAGWDVHNLSHVSQEFDISVPLPECVCEPRTPYEKVANSLPSSEKSNPSKLRSPETSPNPKISMVLSASGHLKDNWI
jgi:hypothetical protein